MNLEQQQIAIAEVCGLNNIRIARTKDGDALVHGNETLVPNYFSDLNGMHEAWHTLDSKHKRLVFHEQLRRKVITDGGHKNSTQGDIDCCCENATAAQRAEAFLRTFNLWID